MLKSKGVAARYASRPFSSAKAADVGRHLHPESNASEEEIISQYKSYKNAAKQLKDKYEWIDSIKKLDQYLWMSIKKDKG